MAKDKMFAEVVIAGSYKNLSKSTRGATKELNIFEKNAKTISTAVSAAFAGIALAGIKMLGDAIVDMTKAAAEDNKSMALLNEQMRRTWHGTDALNKSIDQQIDTMSNMTGIADDKLRPALIRIAAVTKSPSKGMKMLSLSTDIAAKSGQDLNLVSRNMAKFLGGNKTALDKLVPGLSTSGNRMKFLLDNYTGFAKLAGQNDPFARINVVMDNFKEKLGKAFLPMVNSFADWLAGPDAQKGLDDIAKKVQDAFAWINSPEGKAAIEEWYQKAKKLVDQVVRMVDGLAKFLDMMPGGNTLAERDKKTSSDSVSNAAKQIAAALRTSERTSLVQQTNLGNTTGNARRGVDGSQMAATTVNIYGVASGADVMNALTRYARGKGIPMSRLLR